MGCPFCERYQARKSLIYENPFFYAIFDDFPVSPGHALLIPKNHMDSLTSLNTDEWRFLKFSISDVIRVIERTDLEETYEKMLKNPLNDKSEEFLEEILKNPYLSKKTEGYNIGINEGEAAGKTIEHLHAHIIPRFLGDVKDPVGGVRNIIPGKGNYKK
ncbi:MAG: HIT family protein [Candidatus Woesearchaeota archaeon]